MRKLKRDFLEKRQNRPTGIHFTGVPPSLYHLQKLQKHRTISVRKVKRYFFEKRQNRHSGIRFTGVLPPPTICKNSGTIEATLCVT